MKAFFTNIAANLATIALLFLLVLMLTIGLIAAASGEAAPVVPDRAVLVVDLSQALADRPADRMPQSSFDRVFADPGGSKLSLRGAVVALQEAAKDDRISSVLLRGNVASDGLSSGYGGLVEFREALAGVAAAGKPVHAFLVDPTVRDYYVTSVASTITIDPFGSLQFNGLSGTQMHFAGFLEKYGIGIQVSRVGKFKAAVEPFTRTDMSPENRAQTRRYLESTWNEIKRSVAQSREIDTLRLQHLADSVALFTPDNAVQFGLADRVAHFDVLLADLRAITSDSVARAGGATRPMAADSAPAGTAAPNAGVPNRVRTWRPTTSPPSARTVWESPSTIAPVTFSHNAAVPDLSDRLITVPARRPAVCGRLASSTTRVTDVDSVPIVGTPAS